MLVCVYVHSCMWTVSVSVWTQVHLRNKDSIIGCEAFNFPKINAKCHTFILDSACILIFRAHWLCYYIHITKQKHGTKQRMHTDKVDTVTWVHRLKMRQRWYTDRDLLNLDLSILHRKINLDMGQVMSRHTRPHLHRGSARARLIVLWLQLFTLHQSLFCIFQFTKIVCFIARNADAIRHGDCFCFTFSICFPRGTKGNL